MFKVTLPADRAEPDMVAVAKAFGISVQGLIDDIRIGIISRWIEVGDGDADNKPHQISASQKLGLRVDVDEHGNVHSVSKYGTISAGPEPEGADRNDVGWGEAVTAPSLYPGMKENPELTRQTRLDALLDEALTESFPASDPVAISVEPPEQTRRPSPKPEGE